jgi:hypothetical protein
MNEATKEMKSLVQTLVDEASDVDLVCYIARSGGSAALKDLLECVLSAESLSADDLLHNICVVRQKKSEMLAWPLHHVFRRLMRPSVNPTPARVH